MDKRVLLVLYYWPPSGGPGVQRWLKLSKYLVRAGWEPIVYVPENPHYPEIDSSLVRDVDERVEVIKKPIWEPYQLFKKFTGEKDQSKVGAGIFESSNLTWKKKMAIWARGNFFIPDARTFWVKPSISFLSSFIEERGIQRVITSGPPHSLHLIGLGLKRKLDIQWIADFRDPWTDIYYHKDLMLGPRAARKHELLEKEVLSEADIILTASPGNTKLFKDKSNAAIQTLTNGYDPDDYLEDTSAVEQGFIIGHIGSIFRDRNPRNLWRAISELNEEGEDIAIQLTGKWDEVVDEDIRAFGLDKLTEKVGFIPHAAVRERQQMAHALLLLIGPHEVDILPGKLFELIASNRPIIAVGPERSALRDFIESEGLGVYLDHSDKEGMNKALMMGMHGKLPMVADKTKFSRAAQVEQLIELMS